MTVEPPDLEPGDVLVAADAGPAWTPVLPLVRALVLDRGAVGDHAAIMARDLGVPAVMQTGRATKSIPDGATVIVDGTAGVVRVR
jgi:pyruvate,water dikinase